MFACECVLDPENLCLTGFATAASLKCHLKGPPIGWKVQWDAGVSGHERSNHIHGCSLPIHRAEQAIVNEICQTHSRRVPIAVRMKRTGINASDRTRARQNEAALRVTADHICIHSSAAQVFAYFIDD